MYYRPVYSTDLYYRPDMGHNESVFAGGPRPRRRIEQATSPMGAPATAGSPQAAVDEEAAAEARGEKAPATTGSPQAAVPGMYMGPGGTAYGQKRNAAMLMGQVVAGGSGLPSSVAEGLAKSAVPFVDQMAAGSPGGAAYGDARNQLLAIEDAQKKALERMTWGEG